MDFKTLLYCFLAMIIAFTPIPLLFVMAYNHIYRCFFCKHQDLIFIRNIYGDEINRISTKKVYRSLWYCKKCHKEIYKQELYENIS